MWARLAAVVLAVLLVLPAGAATLGKRPARGTPAQAATQAADAPGSTQRGLASWYGGLFHGRRTASGERFDMNEFTAAHRTLPFGTVVEVRSLVNGRTVQVRINDRGPHLARRIIDLSRAAAVELGLNGLGIKQVELTVLAPGASEAEAASPMNAPPAEAVPPPPAEPPATPAHVDEVP
jgi:rare lipoprotein A